MLLPRPRPDDETHAADTSYRKGKTRKKSSTFLPTEDNRKNNTSRDTEEVRGCVSACSKKEDASRQFDTDQPIPMAMIFTQKEDCLSSGHKTSLMHTNRPFGIRFCQAKSWLGKRGVPNKLKVPSAAWSLRLLDSNGRGHHGLEFKELCAAKQISFHTWSKPPLINSRLWWWGTGKTLNCANGTCVANLDHCDKWTNKSGRKIRAQLRPKR